MYKVYRRIESLKNQGMKLLDKWRIINKLEEEFQRTTANCVYQKTVLPLNLPKSVIFRTKDLKLLLDAGIKISCSCAM